MALLIAYRLLYTYRLSTIDLVSRVSYLKSESNLRHETYLMAMRLTSCVARDSRLTAHGSRAIIE
jgi:hypothetical protein